jgi:hypothetical protein
MGLYRTCLGYAACRIAFACVTMLLTRRVSCQTELRRTIYPLCVCVEHDQDNGYGTVLSDQKVQRTPLQLQCANERQYIAKQTLRLPRKRDCLL